MPFVSATCRNWLTMPDGSSIYLNETTQVLRLYRTKNNRRSINPDAKWNLEQNPIFALNNA